MSGMFWALLGFAVLAHRIEATTSMFFNLTVPPNYSNNGDNGTVNLGVQFTTKVNGTITAVMFFANTTAPRHQICVLYAAVGGAELARATFPNETESSAEKWLTCTFDSPVPVIAGQDYVANVWTNRYEYSSPWFRGDITSGDLVIRGSSTNGRFTNSATPMKPTTLFNANYWIDVRFETPSEPLTLPPPPPTTILIGQQSTAATVPTMGNVELTSSFPMATTAGQQSTGAVLNMDSTNQSSLPTSASFGAQIGTRSESESDTGMWIGVGIGVCVLVSLLLLLAFWVARRRRQSKTNTQTKTSFPASMHNPEDYVSVGEYASAREFDSETNPQANVYGPMTSVAVTYDQSMMSETQVIYDQTLGQ